MIKETRVSLLCFESKDRGPKNNPEPPIHESIHNRSPNPRDVDAVGTQFELWNAALARDIPTMVVEYYTPPRRTV